MPNLQFHDLTLKGFGSFIEEAQIQLDHPGLHFVTGINKAQPRLGANGVGKSTLCAALSWVLFGKTQDGLRNPDIHTWNMDRPVIVTLKLGVDGKAHKVTRTTKPNQIRINDKVVGEEAITNLIGVNYQTFNSAILLGQGKELFFDLDPSAKMKLFADVLDLERWQQRSDYTKSLTDKLQQQQTQFQNQIAVNEATIKGLQYNLEVAKQRRDDWSQQQIGKLEQCRADLQNHQNQFDKLSTERGKWDQQADGAGTERLALERELAKLPMKGGWINTLQKQLDSLHKDKRCPTCGQKIVPNQLSKHKAELEDELEMLKKAAVTRAKLETALTGFRQKEEQARDKLNYLTTEIATHKSEISHLRKQIAELEQNENPYHNELQDIRKRLSEQKEQNTILKEQVTKLERRIERYQFWIKGFKDIRLLVIEDTLSELELVSNAMLEELGLIGWEIKYRIEKESKSGNVQQRLDVMILSPFNKEQVRWECWSGGEGQRLRLIGAHALSEVLLNQAGVQTNLEILDEPSRHLSEAGRVDLCDMLAERASTLGRSIFLIDHTVLESTKFASTITVIRDKSGSHILNIQPD